MTEAIEALQAYRLKLKEQNKTLHASVVARCIRVLERAWRRLHRYSSASSERVNSSSLTT